MSDVLQREEFVPSSYESGYEKARLFDRNVADNYIRHTTVGDSELDPVMEELHTLPPDKLHKFIKAGIEQEVDVMRTAPRILRDYFDKVDSDVPAWVDFEAFKPGERAFYANMSNMLIAYALGSAVDSRIFSICIAKRNTWPQ